MNAYLQMITMNKNVYGLGTTDFILSLCTAPTNCSRPV